MTCAFRVVSGAALALIAATSPGCGGKSGPDAYAVSGSVTHEGRPVRGAVVTFSLLTPPADSASGFAGAQVQTDEQGHFEVTSPAAGDRPALHGLPAGEYRVSVIKMESPPGAPSLSNPPRNVLPPQFATPESSPLAATVSADQDNRVDLKL